MISRRQMLYGAIRHLASEPPAQQAYLAGLGVPDSVDELALEFDDIAAARSDMVAVGELTPNECQEISVIHSLLDRISGEAHAHLWTCAALATSAEWTAIRQQAQRCLDLMTQTGSN